MGIVYKFLDFLNQGTLPNHPERSETRSAMLNLVIDYGRRTLSKTGFGDLVLWMIDHGIELPVRPDRTSSESGGSAFDANCGTQSRSYSSHRWTITNTFDGPIVETINEVGNLVASDGFYTRPDTGELEVLPSRNGTSTDISSYSYSVSPRAPWWNSFTTTLVTDTDWHGHLTLCYQQSVQGTIPIPYRSVYEGDIKDTYVPADVSIMSYEVFYQTISRNLCSFTVPDFGRTSQFYADHFNELPQGSPRIGERQGPGFCPDIVPPRGELPPSLPVIGLIAYFTVGSEVFFPGFSRTNIKRSQAIGIVSHITMSFFPFPVDCLQTDPLARALFGDVEPPPWFNVPE